MSKSNKDVAAGARVGLGAIFISFAKIGAVLFGGGYAMLPLLEREVVNRRKWCRFEEMADFYAMAQLIPGVIAVNTSMLIGHRLRGAAGTLAATAGVIFVPVLVILAYAAAFDRMADNKLLLSAMAGLRPAVAGMMAGVAFTMFNRSRKTRLGLVVSLCVVLLVLVCRFSAVAVIVASLAVGTIRYAYTLFKLKKNHEHLS
jgi:chromate transporter